MSDRHDQGGEGTTISGQNLQEVRSDASSWRQTESVAVASLLASDSPRSGGVSRAHIRTLAELVPDLPPILVHRHSMRVIDGMHRLQAHLLKGYDEIEVEYFDGGEDEAFVAAVEANVYHGLPLSLNDRKNASRRILATNSHLSDRAIARIVGLSAKTVGRMRREATADMRHLNTRVGRDGRVRPLDSAERRRTAGELLSSRPTAPLREIAREAGISPATVRDVRDRLRRGQDPVTPMQRKREAADEPSRQARLPGQAAGGALPNRVPSKDLAGVMSKVRQDPSLRYTDAGRSLVRWLELRLPVGWDDLPSVVPPHCAGLISQIARLCADEWQAFAREVEPDDKSG